LVLQKLEQMMDRLAAVEAEQAENSKLLEQLLEQLRSKPPRCRKCGHLQE
jgi:predicted Zn-ribbon and HTH transcriptional regulator